MTARVGIGDPAADGDADDPEDAAAPGGDEPDPCTDVEPRYDLSADPELAQIVDELEGFEAPEVDHPRHHSYGWRDCGDGYEAVWSTDYPDSPDDADTVLDLVAQALARTVPEPPALVTSPPADPGALTGLPTYLAADQTAPLSATAAAGGFSVTATLTPRHLVIDPGDGSDPIRCEGSGTRWSTGERPGPGDCTHTYAVVPGHDPATGPATRPPNAAPPTYPLAIHLVYDASYTVEGPALAGVHDLGTLDGPTTVTDLPVRERRAVRVNP